MDRDEQLRRIWEELSADDINRLIDLFLDLYEIAEGGRWWVYREVSREMHEKCAEIEGLLDA